MDIVLFIIKYTICKIIDKLYNKFKSIQYKKYIRSIYKKEYVRREQIRNSHINKRK